MELLASEYVIFALAVAAVLLYWELREVFSSQADKQKGHHSLLPRLLIRLILPVIGAMLVLQLFGYTPAVLTLPEVAHEPLFIVGQLIFWAGFFLAFWARETIGRHWAHAAEYQVVDEQELVRSGPYRYIRHPIYTALFAIFLGTQMVVASWLILLAVIVYWFIHWQTLQEERLLQKTFGTTYDSYRSRTGRIFPRF